jgi:hypothetical protein
MMTDNLHSCSCKHMKCGPAACSKPEQAFLRKVANEFAGQINSPASSLEPLHREALLCNSQALEAGAAVLHGCDFWQWLDP